MEADLQSLCATPPQPCGWRSRRHVGVWDLRRFAVGASPRDLMRSLLLSCVLRGRAEQGGVLPGPRRVCRPQHVSRKIPLMHLRQMAWIWPHKPRATIRRREGVTGRGVLNPPSWARSRIRVTVDERTHMQLGFVPRRRILHSGGCIFCV
jgi:hypothetical protein